MAAVTVDQVRAARAAGHEAGFVLAPSTPNPYAPTHVPVWRQRQAPDPGRRILARAWTIGYEAGQAAYAQSRGLSVQSD